MTAEEMVKLVAALMGTKPMGRAQKTKGNRYDLRLPGGELGEVKLTNGHPYQLEGFRHSVSNLFGHGVDENDAEYFIIGGRRKFPRLELTWPDNFLFFCFFARSQLMELCPRSGMLNFPANWEPGGVPPKDRLDTAKKNAEICRAVVLAKDLADAEALVAASPNNLTAVARPKARNTMTRLEREQLASAKRIADLEAQLEALTARI
jgi:hypothetical protein